MICEAVELREYLPSDDARTVRWLNDPEMRETFGLTYTVDVKSHRQWFDRQNNLFIKAIESQGEHVGNAILHLNLRHENAVLEIYVGESNRRGQGIGLRALELLLKLGFIELGLHRISLVTRTDNLVAEKIYRRAGFSLEGCEKQSIKVQEKFIDQHLWALLKEDWLVKQNV